MKVTTDACLFGAWVADDLKTQAAIKQVLDIGSGTGLLSLMIAQMISGSVQGVEIQEPDFQQAVQNVNHSPWADRISIIHGDATKEAYKKKYNVIISNPPFYESDLKSDQPEKNIAHHNEGLLLKDLIAVIKNQLEPDGNFYLLMKRFL